MSKTIKLSNVDVASLKSLFERSLTVNPTLYFEITPEKIQSFTTNQQDAFCKNWETPVTGILEHNNDFQLLKFFFLFGAPFANKILGFFDKAELNITVSDDGETVSQLTIIEKAKGLKFDINTSNILFANTIPKEKQAQRFDVSNSVAKFEITPQLVAAITSLSGITEFSEQQIDYVKFSGVDGTLSVSNNMFNKEIGTYTGEAFEAKLYKSFLGLIDKEDNTVDLCNDPNNDGVRTFVLTNKHAEIKSQSCAAIMTEISMDDEFNLDDDDNSSW